MKRFYGLTDEDLSEIEPSYLREADEENPVEIVKYSLWDILKLKASRKAGAGFHDIISLTQAMIEYNVSTALGFVLRFSDTWTSNPRSPKKSSKRM